MSGSPVDPARVARLAAADQECLHAYDNIVLYADRFDGLDIVEATRRLGYLLAHTNTPDVLAFTLAYLALRHVRDGA